MFRSRMVAVTTAGGIVTVGLAALELKMLEVGEKGPRPWMIVPSPITRPLAPRFTFELKQYTVFAASVITPPEGAGRSASDLTMTLHSPAAPARFCACHVVPLQRRTSPGFTP